MRGSHSSLLHFKVCGCIVCADWHTWHSACLSAVGGMGGWPPFHLVVAGCVNRNERLSYGRHDTETH